MLKNELEILAAVFNSNKERLGFADLNERSGFSKSVNQCCNQAREAWSVAAFADHSHEALQRYFNFHFNFLNGMIAENTMSGHSGGFQELSGLMDDLLRYYKHFIDQRQTVSREFSAYRLKSLHRKYKRFINQLNLLNADDDLKLCLVECLSPIYSRPPAETMELGSLFYKEELIVELSGKRNSPELMTAENLIFILISFNFNHVRFLRFLCKKAINGIVGVSTAKCPTYFGELITQIPTVSVKDNHCFDSNWPHISVMYKDWLKDYRDLLDLTLKPTGHHKATNKIPLNMSVKQLGCMIRALYESGYYGNISLTAIFDHAAVVFTTKKQEQISAESISNAYYGISLSASLKVSRMFGHAAGFLRPYCSLG